MNIGEAVQALKNGRKIRRAGWNGKGMFLVLIPGSRFIVTADRPLGKACPEWVGEELSYHAHVDMYTAQEYMVPWLCSQADLLADDWEFADA